jgi:hypothetical protein
MFYRILGDVVMAFHFAFLVYVALGGFLAWRWPKAIWPHLALAGWGFSTVLFGINCPLTYVEDWARRQAGQAGLSSGFIDTYLEGVVYPQRFAVHLQAMVATLVVISWVGAVIRWRARRPARPNTAPHS